MTVFLKIFSKNTQNTSILVTNLKCYCFTWNFAFCKIRGCWYQIWKKIFSNFTANSKKHRKVWSRPLKFLGLFRAKLCSLVNSRVLISNVIIILSIILQPKTTQIKAFSVQNVKFFYFTWDFVLFASLIQNY